MTATDAYPLHKGESLEMKVQDHAVRLQGVEKDIGMLKEDTADLCADVDSIKTVLVDVGKSISVTTALMNQIGWFVKAAAGAFIAGAIALIIKALGG